jgi:hypothetical protein
MQTVSRLSQLSRKAEKQLAVLLALAAVVGMVNADFEVREI